MTPRIAARSRKDTGIGSRSFPLEIDDGVEGEWGRARSPAGTRRWTVTARSSTTVSNSATFSKSIRLSRHPTTRRRSPRERSATACSTERRPSRDSSIRRMASSLARDRRRPSNGGDWSVPRRRRRTRVPRPRWPPATRGRLDRPADDTMADRHEDVPDRRTARGSSRRPRRMARQSASIQGSSSPPAPLPRPPPAGAPGFGRLGGAGRRPEMPAPPRDPAISSNMSRSSLAARASDTESFPTHP